MMSRLEAAWSGHAELCRLGLSLPAVRRSWPAGFDPMRSRHTRTSKGVLITPRGDIHEKLLYIYTPIYYIPGSSKYPEQWLMQYPLCWDEARCVGYFGGLCSPLGVVASYVGDLARENAWCCRIPYQRVRGLLTKGNKSVCRRMPWCCRSIGCRISQSFGLSCYVP